MASGGQQSIYYQILSMVDQGATEQ